MPVTLENRIRRMQVFHLPHEMCCGGHCTCTELTVVTTVEHPRTGERAQRPHRKVLPGSITFLALERKTGLPSGLLQVAEVKEAIDRGYLRVVEQKPDVSTAAAPAPAVAPPPAPSAVTPPPVVKATSFVPGTPAVARKEPS